MALKLGPLKGRMGLCLTVGGCAVTACTVPIIVANSGGVGAMNEVLKQIPLDQLKMGERTTQLANAYKSQTQDLKVESVQDLKEIITKLKTNGDFLKDGAGALKEHHDAANYYLFEYGDLVKGLLKRVPEIVNTSIDEADATGLNVQKIYEIIKDKEFGPFMQKMHEKLKTHKSIMQNLTDDEVNTVLDQFKHMEKDSISTILKKVTDNADNLEADYSSCRSKFFLHLFTGKTSAEQAKKALEGVQAQLESMKGQQTSDGKTLDVDTLKATLEESLQKLKKLNCEDTSSQA